ncbi:MAG: UDP-glucose 4-epimerase GalE [Clostridiales Family XIII bacterium]|jgi:UDP-glucose 4-epimerase|nr:UDP-glucose 4-epimerase GalE [Clostridiales Family XIII bacterium]
MSKKKVLVTGGTGFIGSHTAAVLLDQGCDAVIFDNLSNSKIGVVDRIRRIAARRPDFAMGDIRDKAALSALFRAHDFDAVIHFAGLKAVGESVAKPLPYYENNITGSLALYEAMGNAGVRTLIFSSSATVYGPVNHVPYLEGMPLSATNPYGWTKLMNEQILRDLCAADPSWSVALLRYFNPGGAHRSGLIGEDPNGIPNNLLPYAAKVAAGELERIHIFGDDYDTPDGTGVRDYIHVMDLARGHALALDWLAAKRRGAGAGSGATAINLGTGKGTSVREIIAAFEAACGKTLPAVVGPRRPGDLAATYADAGLARELLGFETEYGIEDICADIWKWQQYAAENGI